MDERAGSLRGMTDPSTRKSGAEPVVMCISLAPLSIIALRSCCRVTRSASGASAIAEGYGATSARLEPAAPHIPHCPSRRRRTAKSARSGTLIAHRDAQNFLGTGDAVHRFADPASSQGAHSLFDGGSFELGRRSALEHHFLQAVAEFHHLVERHAALVAGA